MFQSTSGNLISDFNGTGDFPSLSTGYALNAWNHFAVTADGSQIKYYINGTLAATDSGTQEPVGNTSYIFIGQSDVFGDGAYTGNLDEIRVSSAARSADWIKTEYNNENSPSTFITVGSAQTSGGSGGRVVAPTFSVAPGIYSSGQSVTLSSTTSGATIRYTMDGTNPTETLGTVYTGTIALNTSAMIKAIAYLSGMTDSQITTAAYVIGSTVAPGPHLGLGFDTMGRPQTLRIPPPTLPSSAEPLTVHQTNCCRLVV